MITAIIFFVSGFLQGMTSFGFSLIALPLLTLLYDMQLVVPVLVLYSFVMNTTILLNLWRNVEIKEIAWIALTGIIFTPIGMQILLYVEGPKLKLFAGVFVFVFALLLFFNKRYEIKNERLGYLVTGALSGLLNGSISFSGPALIIFMANKGIQKQKFRASLTFYFWILNIITIPTFYFGGLIGKATLVFSLKYVIFLIVGVLMGVFIGNRMQEKIFNRLVVVVLMVLGVISIISTLGIV
jgi:uncharacterized membrane protein YfcA